MAIEYIKKRQKLYRNSKTKEVYLAKANYNNYINSRVLSEEVSKRCSISATIVTMVLQEVEGCIASHLASGDVVKLDAIGNFAPTIKAKAQDNPEKVNKFSIEKTSILFCPSLTLKAIIKNAGVKIADKNIYRADSHPSTKVIK